MLAAPLQPAAILESRDLAQYRPAKDIETFKSLLPPPVEFLEGSSSGSFAVAEGKYQPINGSGSGTSKVAAKPELRDARRVSIHDTEKPASSAQAASNVKSLYDKPIELSWPHQSTAGCGLVNTGNTCFLNSAIQCLLHTPPLLHVLERHSNSDKCLVAKPAFCMSCSMRDLMFQCRKASHPLMPYAITSKLQQIAKHMRKGRQEDSHEFLRYAIDALQKSCLTGQSPKIDPKLAETTWVHKMFGGRLRSRVTCQSCGYNSDTFDSILDLSIDIYNVHTIRDALRKFVAVDHLKGADKYRCEKCKKHVTAEKQFTIHEAPTVLTIHLKRFTPMGRKMAHLIRYDDRISLRPYMSQGSFGPTYNLYGVISHAGGGPNSGHYYAHVKDARGKWHEMNDESVSYHHGPPLHMKSAYILFYLKEKGQELDAAVRDVATPSPPIRKAGIVAGMKRKKTIESDDEDEDAGRPAPTPASDGKFIGPLLPSPTIDVKAAEPRPDPQAELLKRKIAEKQTPASSIKPASPTKPAPSSQPASPTKPVSPVKPSAALQSLAQYADEDDSDDVGEKVERKADSKLATPSPPSPVQEKSLSALPVTPPPSTPVKKSAPMGPIPAASFYAPTSQQSKRKDAENERKRKSPEPSDDGEEERLSRYARTPLSHSPNLERKGSGQRKFAGGNPFNRISNNLHTNSSPMVRYGKHGKRGKPRAL